MTRTARIAWTILSLLVAELIICGVAAAPLVVFWHWLGTLAPSHPLLRLTLVSLAIGPSYLLFALLLLFVTPIATRGLGWRTPADVEMHIADCGWPLLGWARGAAALHLCRVVGGTLLHGTPVWTAHLRLCGARLGRRVYVNSLSLNDYNLIECGDDVVIGDGVHLSGHTVEAGIVKTGRVRVGHDVTIGLDTVLEIDVEIGSHVQVGAMSFIPKHATLAGNAVYAGVPATRLATDVAATGAGNPPPGSRNTVAFTGREVG